MHKLRTKIVFRADGSSNIGLGHLVRCLALAQMISNKREIHFYCKAIPELFANEILSYGFQISKIDSETDFLNQLNGTQIVVIDHYGLDTEYQKLVKNKGCKLICIDDTADQIFFADLIINHAPGIVPEFYQAQSYTRYALGTDYALLRPEFLNNAKKNRSKKTINNLFVCLGGADSNNFTERIVAEAINTYAFAKITIVTGAAFEHLDRLLPFLSNSIVKHYHAIDERLMAELMYDSDLAIVPASGILLEAIASGCIVISSCFVKNQEMIFEGFKKLDAAYFFNSFEDVNKNALMEFLTTYKFKPHRKLIDGSSGFRLNQLIEEM